MRAREKEDEDGAYLPLSSSNCHWEGDECVVVVVIIGSRRDLLNDSRSCSTKGRPDDENKHLWRIRDTPDDASSLEHFGIFSEYIHVHYMKIFNVR